MFFLIFRATVVVNRYNILYTCYTVIFTIFTFWETSIEWSTCIWHIPEGDRLIAVLMYICYSLFLTKSLNPPSLGSPLQANTPC